MKIRLFIFILLTFQTLSGYAQTSQVTELIENYRYREAIELLEESSQSIDNLLLMADCYQQVNDYNPAIYDSLSANYPENRNILMAGAECAYQSGNPDLSLLPLHISARNCFQKRSDIISRRLNGGHRLISSSTTLLPCMMRWRMQKVHCPITSVF